MRVVHFSDTEFTTIPETTPVRVRLDSDCIMVYFPGREGMALHFFGGNDFSHTREHTKREYVRFMEWLRSGDENSDFRFVFKVPQLGEVRDTPAFLGGLSASDVVDRIGQIGPVGLIRPIDSHSPLPVAAEVAAVAVILGEVPESVEVFPHN